MEFVSSTAVQNNVLSDAEKSAIIREAYNEYWDAYHIAIVDGGLMVFDTYDEFITWENQA